MDNDKQQSELFIHWFRASSPYIRAHRGRTFVISFGGEMAADESFPAFIHDVALLHSLGVRVVLVAGIRPQIDQRLSARNIETQFHRGLRVTDDRALECVKEAAGQIRVEIEALLSMGLANTPAGAARVRVTTGNFVVAKPLGVRDGIDYCHTGEVRRIDTESIVRNLDDGGVVLLSPVGYSPTGEIFNLGAEELAGQVAVALKADKLVCLTEAPGLGALGDDQTSQLTPVAAETLIADSSAQLDDRIARHAAAAIYACRYGVRRSHIVDRTSDGGLLLELFTRDGIGTLITNESYEGIRQARIDDVGGILTLIEPLEAEGTLVRRSRELLEMEIDHFTVVERDGMIVACCALHPFKDAGELACVAVHPEYRKTGRGDALLEHVEKLATKKGLGRVFVLTTRSSHWFQERGYLLANIQDLPVERQELYNYQRNSKVLLKTI